MGECREDHGRSSKEVKEKNQDEVNLTLNKTKDGSTTISEIARAQQKEEKISEALKEKLEWLRGAIKNIQANALELQNILLHNLDGRAEEIEENISPQSTSITVESVIEHVSCGMNSLVGGMSGFKDALDPSNARSCYHCFTKLCYFNSELQELSKEVAEWKETAKILSRKRKRLSKEDPQEEIES